MRHVAACITRWFTWPGAVALLLLAGAALPAQGQYFRFGKNKVQYGAPEWSYVQSKHFDVYYYEGGRYLADFTARAAEEAYVEIAKLFDHEISDRIPLLVYQSHNDFAVTNAVNLPTYAEGIGGVTELFKNRIAIPFTGDYRDFRRVVHHELVHAVLNDMFYGGSIQSIIQNNIQLRIPLWFNEGLAEYSALGWDSNSDMYVREAVLEDHLAPIPYLSGYFAYRGGQSVWDYVAEQYGREKIGEVLQRLRLSRSVDGAFKRATGLELDDLSDRWQETLKEVYYPEVAAREDLDDVAKAIITRESGGAYNTSPAISPQGDKVAFITTKGGLFDVYLASANDGEIIKKLIDGQNNTQFESLRILTPGLSWSPDGKRIAIAVKSGEGDAIALVDVETEKAKHYRIPDVDQIVSVAWSPLGDKIAFEGSRDAQGDIYVLDLETKETLNYTGDIFSDHEPAWSPDGQTLVFHSDRGAFTELGRYQPGDFAMIEHDYGQFDLYRMAVSQTSAPTRAERLTTDEVWDEKSAQFGSDPDRLLFISDRNGIYNLYEKNLTSGVERPLTDTVVGIIQVSLSADGQKAALMSLKEGTPSIFVMKEPFEQRLEADELVPNVWAQRVMQEAHRPAPALALAPPSLLKRNPYLRDATDGVAFVREPRRPAPDVLASRAPTLADFLDGDSDFSGTNFEERLLGRKTSEESEADSSEKDTTAYGGVRVDFRNYVFSEAFEAARANEVDEYEYDPMANRFSPSDNVDEDGAYKPKKYKLSFSPDLVYGTAGVETLYGVQGVTQMIFSDMLGNHSIVVSTNLLIDLRNSDYIVAYNWLPRRVDWSFSGFHLSRLFQDYRQRTSYRYRQYGGVVSASYPLDKFRRLDVDLSVLGASRADVFEPAEIPVSRTLFYPGVTFTKDVAVPGMMFPVGGHRFAVSVSGSPGLAGGKELQFATLIADARAYTSFGRGMYSFAVRGSGGSSLGTGQQLFYSSGVQNWINRYFDSANGFPITDVTDFIFARPVLPLRGFDINTRNGSHFGLFNAEFRFPLIAALLPGPIPLFPLYNLQGSAFVDAGAIWGGRGIQARFNPETEEIEDIPNRSFNLTRTNGDNERVLDDLLVGAGFGLRTIFLGYPVRLDFAWPYDGRRFGARRTYLSVGFDF